MKILTASVALALTLGLSGLTSAMAEPFKDKSVVDPHWNPTMTADRYDHNSDGKNMALSTPSESNRSPQAYCEITVPSLGFNQETTAQRTC